jgi:streptogrisin C
MAGPLIAGLSPQQQRVVDQRAQLGRHIPALEQRFERSAPAAFAGAYLDASGVTVVKFTTHVRRYGALARAMLPDPAHVRVAPARYSLRVLTAVHRRIDAQLPALLRAGLPITTVAVDVVANRVAVSVARRSSAIELALRSRFGPAIGVDVVNVAPANRESVQSPPLDGGLEINDGSYECTSGFVTQAPNGGFFILTPGTATAPGRPGTRASSARRPAWKVRSSAPSIATATSADPRRMLR